MDRINFVKPKVILLSTMDNRGIAWRFSRNTADSYSKVNDWKYTDFTLHDMMQVTLLFENASVALRETMTILRPMSSLWARSSRADKQFNLIDLGYNEREKEVLLSKMKSALDMIENKHADLGRELYPLGVSVGWTVTLTFRLLMLWLKSLQDICPLYFKNYGEQILDQLNIDLDEFEKFNYKKDMWKSYIVDEKEFEDNKIDRIPGYVSIMSNSKFSFISQLVRQSQNKVLTNFYSLLKEYGEKYIETEMNQGSMIKLHLLDSNLHMDQVSKTRSCFIAERKVGGWNNHAVYNLSKFKLGEKLIVSKNMPCECDPNKCIYQPEAEGGMRGEFGNYPCSIYNSKYGEKTTYWYEREKKVFKEGNESLYNYLDKMFYDELGYEKRISEVDKLAFHKHGDEDV